MSGGAAANGARARLLGRVGETRGLEAEIGTAATIGRNAGNDVVLASPLVSGEHARIVYEAEPGCFFLEDLGSLNGTELDGAPVHGRERLGRLHVLRFGGAAELIFQGPELLPSPTVAGEREPAAAGEKPAVGDAAAGEAPPAGQRAAGEAARPAAADAGPAAGATVPAARSHGPAPADAPAGPREAAAPPAPAAAPAFALVVTLAGSERRFPLQPGANPVGRSRSSAVCIDSPEISRRHALLTVDGERVLLRDEGSSNHTFAGGRCLAEGEELALEPGAELRFGKITARLDRRRSARDR